MNHKKVERIWRQEGLKVPRKQPKRGRLWWNDGSCVRKRSIGITACVLAPSQRMGIERNPAAGEDFDPETSRPVYEAMLERGKNFVRDLRPSAGRSVEDTTNLLERISRLREANAIDDDEFQRLKREVLPPAA